MSYDSIRAQIVEYAQKLYTDRLVSCTSGNISVRIPDHPDWMAITPGSEDYMTMTPDRVVITDLDGNVVDGVACPSSEWRLHAGIYRARPDVGAIVHTHSAYSTAFAVLGERVPVVLSEMVPWLGGDIPVAPYEQMGTWRLAETSVPLLATRHACLLGNHGPVAVAGDLPLAYARAAYVEDAARVYHLARSLGTPIELTEEQIAAIR